MIRVVNFYRDVEENGDLIRLWRHEIQVRNEDGTWSPVPVIEQEDPNNDVSILPGDLDDGC